MEREEMPCDVLFVGGGPANLAGAIHLMNLIEAHNASWRGLDPIDEPMIMVLEKGSPRSAPTSCPARSSIRKRAVRADSGLEAAR